MVDDTAHAPMGFVGFRRGAVLFLRALTLRCPNCGARGILPAMVLTPILLYPFSRLAWLAFDLMLRLVVPNDLASPPNAR
jgi:hypothetical protein